MSNLIISFNVGSSSSLAGLYQLIRLFDPLFVFLQEVTITSEQLIAQVGGSYLGICNTDENDGNKPGTAVLWKKGSDAVVVNVVPLRLQLLKSNVYGNFINIYAPTGNQGEQARRHLFTTELLSLTQTSVPQPVLIGDWNCLARKEDVENWQTLSSDSLKQRISAHLKQLVRDGGYTDGYLLKNSNRIGFTWRRRGRNSSRLDRIYIPSNRLDDFLSPAEHHSHFSDHDA